MKKLHNPAYRMEQKHYKIKLMLLRIIQASLKTSPDTVMLRRHTAANFSVYLVLIALGESGKHSNSRYNTIKTFNRMGQMIATSRPFFHAFP
jgi:hypothetical protein